jgi:hypothetical protein
MKLSREQVLGIARHILTFAGGLAVAKGLVDAETVSTIAGSVITLIGAIWSVVVKNKAA